MRRFFINFRTSIHDRAGAISAQAYGHYLRLRPYLGKIRSPSNLIQKAKGKIQNRLPRW